MLAVVSSQTLNTMAGNDEEAESSGDGSSATTMEPRLDVPTLRAHMCGVAANLTKRRACQCPVCMDVMSAPARLKCRHVFCRTCIDTVIELAQPNHPRCPVCNVEFRRREVVKEEVMDNYVQAYRLLQSVARRNGATVSDSQMPLDEAQALLDEKPPPARLERSKPAKRPKRRRSEARQATGRRVDGGGRGKRSKATATRDTSAAADTIGESDVAEAALAVASAARAAAAPAVAPLPAARSSKPRARSRRSRPARGNLEMSEEEQLALALKLSAQDERIQRQKRRHDGDIAAAAAAAAGSSHRELKNLTFAAPGSRQAVALGPCAAPAAGEASKER